MAEEESARLIEYRQRVNINRELAEYDNILALSRELNQADNLSVQEKAWSLYFEALGIAFSPMRLDRALARIEAKRKLRGSH